MQFITASHAVPVGKKQLIGHQIQRRVGTREWLKSFALAVLWIALTVAVASLLAYFTSASRRP